ncbi:citrate/2-methylcitrate synthase, partial [Pseudoalteromonas sp. SIMBA_162]
CYLLLFGELPSDEEYDKFAQLISNHTMVHEQIVNFFKGFRRDAHPMAILCGVVGGLAAFYHDNLNITNEKERYVSAVRLIAKMP